MCNLGIVTLLYLHLTAWQIIVQIKIRKVYVILLYYNNYYYLIIILLVTTPSGLSFIVLTFTITKLILLFNLIRRSKKKTTSVIKRKINKINHIPSKLTETIFINLLISLHYLHNFALCTINNA